MQFINKLICMIFNHRLRVHAKPGVAWAIGIRWLKCSRCGTDLVVNDSVGIVLPMDFEIMDLHDWVLERETK